MSDVEGGLELMFDNGKLAKGYNEYPCLNHKSEFPIGITTTCDFLFSWLSLLKLVIVFRIISTIQLSIKFTNLYEGKRNPYLTR